MYSRPKPGETEDDLLRLQEEFEKQKTENKITPAAQVVGDKIKGKYFVCIISVFKEAAKKFQKTK